MALIENGFEFIHVIISLAILLFAAKVFAEIFHRLKMPIVLGQFKVDLTTYRLTPHEADIPGYINYSQVN
jgi:hypothetical protein